MDLYTQNLDTIVESIYSNSLCIHVAIDLISESKKVYGDTLTRNTCKECNRYWYKSNPRKKDYADALDENIPDYKEDSEKTHSTKGNQEQKTSGKAKTGGHKKSKSHKKKGSVSKKTTVYHIHKSQRPGTIQKGLGTIFSMRTAYYDPGSTKLPVT